MDHILIIIIVAIILVIGIIIACKSAKANDNNVVEAKNTTLQPTTEGARGKKSALEQTKAYLEVVSFSREQLISMLESEGYSKKEATYAADNCNIDWNEQALRHVNLYLHSAPSYALLIKQLETDKFTPEQAKYAADNCGADWKEQAAKTVRATLKFRDATKLAKFTRQQLIDQLLTLGFTPEEAEYGVSQTGY